MKNNRSESVIEKYKYLFEYDEEEDDEDQYHKLASKQLNLGKFLFIIERILEENLLFSQSEFLKSLSRDTSLIIDAIREIQTNTQLNIINYKTLFNDTKEYYKFVCNEQFRSIMQCKNKLYESLFYKGIYDVVFYPEQEENKELSELAKVLSNYETKIVFILSKKGDIFSYGPDKNNQWEYKKIEDLRIDEHFIDYEFRSRYRLNYSMLSEDLIKENDQNGLVEHCKWLAQIKENKSPILITDKHENLKFAWETDSQWNLLDIDDNNGEIKKLINVLMQNRKRAKSFKKNSYYLIKEQAIIKKVFTLVKDDYQPIKNNLFYLPNMPSKQQDDQLRFNVKRIIQLPKIEIENEMQTILPIYQLYPILKNSGNKDTIDNRIENEKDKYLNPKNENECLYLECLMALSRNIKAIERNTLKVIEDYRYIQMTFDDDRLFRLYDITSKLDIIYSPVSQKFEPLAGANLDQRNPIRIDDFTGGCAGYVISWANNIKNNLGESSSLFLMDKETFINQSNQRNDIYYNLDKEFKISYDKEFARNLLAKLNPHVIYKLSLNKEDTVYAHATGIRKFSTVGSNDFQVEYFEPNFGYFLFRNQKQFNIWFPHFLHYTNKIFGYDFDTLVLNEICSLNKKFEQKSFLRNYPRISNKHSLTKDFVFELISTAYKNYSSNKSSNIECKKELIKEFQHDCTDILTIYLPCMNDINEIKILREALDDEPYVSLIKNNTDSPLYQFFHKQAFSVTKINSLFEKRIDEIKRYNEIRHKLVY